MSQYLNSIPGGIVHPDNTLTLEERAHHMWAVHPLDLDRLGFKTREAFYLAHLQAAVRDQNAS